VLGHGRGRDHRKDLELDETVPIRDPSAKQSLAVALHSCLHPTFAVRCSPVEAIAGRETMSARKQFQTNLSVSPELMTLLQEAKNKEVSEEELHEQRISFAFGNALKSDRITKESVRRASRNIRLK
jgi:hypothetical protein